MNSLEAENVCNFLRSKDIHLSPNNDWLISCINWYKNHPDLRNVYGPLQDYVFIQWSLADLEDVRYGCLPTRCKDENFTLTGKYAVQVNSIRDIGQSCYSQIQKIQNKNHLESNDYVSADDQRKQNWEPNPKQVLMLEITDGVTTLRGLEYSPIEKLSEVFLPGVKVVLLGPIECRKGIALLKNNNINLLGGEVDHLYESNSKETILAQCLNMQPTEPIAAERNNHNTRTVHRNNVVQNNTSHPVNNIRPIERPSEVMERNHLPQGNDMLLSDEDDDFLCQLPDDILDNVNPPSNVISNVQNTRYTYEMQTNLGNKNNVHSNNRPIQTNNKPLTNNKPKLFPSLEDVRFSDVDESADPIKISPINSRTSLTDNTPLAAKPKAASTHNAIQSINVSSTSEIKYTTNDTHANYMSKTNNSKSNVPVDVGLSKIKLPETSIGSINEESAVENMIIDDEYPKLKEIIVKVDCVTKVKIRNGEWYCTANATFENESKGITFSDEVLKKIFGISAAEVEVWREEMANNPALKNKVNNILKCGQAKLKSLNCTMTLEYPMEDCEPQVVNINSN